MDEKITKLMKNLDLTEEEARQLIEDDKRIDKGEKLFSLTDEQEKASKKARNTTAKKQPTAYKFEKRERKSDNVKRELVKILQNALAEQVTDLEIINPEREFSFKFDGKKYKIVLSAPRS